MTIHDRDKIIAAAIGCIEGPYDRSRAITITGNEIERLYAIAFEDGRQAEREECAKVCMQQCSVIEEPHEFERCAEAIRARGDRK